ELALGRSEAAGSADRLRSHRARPGGLGRCRLRRRAARRAAAHAGTAGLAAGGADGLGRRQGRRPDGRLSSPPRPPGTGRCHRLRAEAVLGEDAPFRLPRRSTMLSERSGFTARALALCGILLLVPCLAIAEAPGAASPEALVAGRKRRRLNSGR